MAQIGNSVLRVLNRLYSFVGGVQGVQNMDLLSPVTVVHDVSREAELGSDLTPFLGFHVLTQQLNHAGADTQRAATDPFTQVATYGAIPDHDISLWLLDCTIYPSTNAIGVVYCALFQSLQYPGVGAAGYYPSKVIRVADDQAGVANFAGGGTAYQGITANTAFHAVDQIRDPILIHPGSRFTTASTSTGAMALIVHWFLWAGRRGTTPPGMG